MMCALTAELTIVIPVYNEGEAFPALWRAITTQIACRFHALVVYDFDGDSTIPAVEAIVDRGERRLTLVKNIVGKGVVGALLTGFRAAASGPVLVVMADLCDDLSQVYRMLAFYRAGYQVVAGSRYMPGGRTLHGPWIKQMLSRLAGLSLHWLRGVPTHDATNAFKLYDGAMLRRLKIESRHGFELNLEITVKAFLAGARIAELPTTWRDREQGESKFRLWAWLPHYLYWYLYAFRPRARRMPQELPALASQNAAIRTSVSARAPSVPSAAELPAAIHARSNTATLRGDRPHTGE